MTLRLVSPAKIQKGFSIPFDLAIMAGICNACKKIITLMIGMIRLPFGLNAEDSVEEDPELTLGTETVMGRFVLVMLELVLTLGLA